VHAGEVALPGVQGFLEGTSNIDFFTFEGSLPFWYHSCGLELCLAPLAALLSSGQVRREYFLAVELAEEVARVRFNDDLREFIASALVHAPGKGFRWGLLLELSSTEAYAGVEAVPRALGTQIEKRDSTSDYTSADKQ